MTTDPETKLVIGIMGIVVALIVAGAFMSENTGLRSSGHIDAQGLTVYADPARATPLTEINWGNMTPGDQKNVTIYLWNARGNSGRLGMTTYGWTPPVAANYLNVTWNCENATMAVGVVLNATITLTVDPWVENVTAFEFTILLGFNA